MPVKITVKKNQAIEQEMAYIDAHTVRVGVLTGGILKGQESDASAPHRDSKSLTVAQVFAFHELGLGHNPKRSSIVWAVDNRKAEIEALSEKAMLAVMSGKMTGRQALGLIGEKIVSLSKKRIKDRIPPRLSAGRLRQKMRGGKSGDVPLIHTGQLINSLRWNILGALR